MYFTDPSPSLSVSAAVARERYATYTKNKELKEKQKATVATTEKEKYSTYTKKPGRQFNIFKCSLTSQLIVIPVLIKGDHSGRRKSPVDLVPTVPAACGPLL